MTQMHVDLFCVLVHWLGRKQSGSVFCIGTMKHLHNDGDHLVLLALVKFYFQVLL